LEGEMMNYKHNMMILVQCGSLFFSNLKIWSLWLNSHWSNLG